MDDTGVKQARPFSERTMRLALALVRLVPRWLGYPLAEWAARLHGRLAPRARAILESNLAPVLGTDDPRRLRRVAVQIFGHAAREYYEMFYLPGVPRDKIAKMIEHVEPGYSQFAEAYRQGRGAIIVAPHQSSVDLAGQSMRALGYSLVVLALPEQAEGFAFMNRLRTFQGARVIPVGPPAVREALRALQRGELVVTGADRPVKGQGTVVQFFGRPTLLPDGPVRLTMHTGSPLFFVYCQREQGKYWMHFQLMEPIRSGDDEADVRENVQQIARAMEPAIRAHPEQWHLFQRLWD